MVSHLCPYQKLHSQYKLTFPDERNKVVLMEVLVGVVALIAVMFVIIIVILFLYVPLQS